MMTQEHLPLRIEGLDEYQARVIENSPPWLKAVRQRAVAQFIQLDFPTIKDEEYKYTSLTELTNRRWQLASMHKLVGQHNLGEHLDQADINIVLVNGVIWGEASTYREYNSKDLTICSLMEAVAKFPTEVEATISKLTANDTRSLLYLNQALFLDGVFIKVQAGAAVLPLVHIIHLTNGVEDNTVLFPRALIHVGDQAQVSILETHLAFGSMPYWSNAVTDIRVGQSAQVEYCKAEAEGIRATHTGTTRVWQEKASSLDLFTFNHRAQMTRNNLSVMLKGEGTNTIMNGFYALDANQHVDNHTLIDIQQPNCTSYQLYKGLLNGQSRAVFNGKIYVHAVAQKTNGYQLNKHLLLGKDARVDTKPQLEIFADDVKCTHGATIGQLNADEIFYLQSRGIAKETAVALLSKGFINDIINTVKSDSVRSKLSKLLSARFPEVKL